MTAVLSRPSGCARPVPAVDRDPVGGEFGGGWIRSDVGRATAACLNINDKKENADG